MIDDEREKADDIVTREWSKEATCSYIGHVNVRSIGHIIIII